MKRLWKEYEEELLRKEYPTTPAKVLAGQLNRSVGSVENKAKRMGLKKSIYYDRDIGEEITPERIILGVLQRSKHPLTFEQLMENSNLGLSELSFARELEKLRLEGYDIKGLETARGKLYGLVRTSEFDPTKYYKQMGEIKTPVLMTGDWHVGNKYHSHQAFMDLLACCEEYSVATVVINGDLLQGKGVHRREAMDLIMLDLDYQIDTAVSMLNMIPKCVEQIAIVMGNHESFVKGNIRVGWDMCASVARRVPRAVYYGGVANIELDDKWEYLAFHGEGAVGYAVSYKGQRIRDNLVQRPHILHLAHIHQPYDIPRPHQSGRASTITSASLKRESTWEMQRGWTSIIGWWILHYWSPRRKLLEEFSPKVY